MGLAQVIKSAVGVAADQELPQRAMTQAECDAIQAAVRRGDDARTASIHPIQEHVDVRPTACIIEARLSQEVEYAQRLLEAVGDCFVSDPQILERHETTMQSFDIIGQLLGHIAKVIGADNKEAAIDQIGMQELRSRLKRPID